MGRGSLFLAADGALLGILWPTARRAAALLGRLDTAAAEHGPDAVLSVLAGGALWLVCAWLAAGLLAAGAARLPGGAGRLARAVAERLLPGTLQRIVAGSAGLGVLLAPVAAAAAPSGPPGPPPAAISTSATVPTPGWPLDPPSRQPVATPTWPTEPTDPASAPRDQPGPPAHAAPRPPVPHDIARPRPVTVRPGDSLWLIAARRLGDPARPARIAAEWPRWYAANRQVIGPDPNLIRPGQELTAPDKRAGGAS